jgi:3-oxoadipate enol-lactonase
MLGHGLATHLGLWDDLVGVLTPDFRVLRYDARGHGRSSVPNGDYTLDNLVDDARRLLEALQIKRTHFVGLSMGGMVALGLALSCPDKVGSIAVCDARAQATEEYAAGWDRRIGVVREGGLGALVDRTLERWFTEEFRATRPDVIADMRRMICGTSPAGYIGCAAALKRLDYGAQLGRINMPVLYLVGANDLGAPPPAVRAAQAATPRSQYVEIPQAGHMSNVEQPKAFAQAIVRFLSDVEHGRL